MKLDEIELLTEREVNSVSSIRRILASYVQKYIPKSDWQIRGDMNKEAFRVEGSYSTKNALNVVKDMLKDNPIAGWIPEVEKGNIVLTKDDLIH